MLSVCYYQTVDKQKKNQIPLHVYDNGIYFSSTNFLDGQIIPEGIENEKYNSSLCFDRANNVLR